MEVKKGCSCTIFTDDVYLVSKEDLLREEADSVEKKYEHQITIKVNEDGGFKIIKGEFVEIK